jgi:uncharacterized protein DUF6221
MTESAAGALAAALTFLECRLLEEEAGAQAASPGPWSYGVIGSTAGGSVYDATIMVASVNWDNNAPDPRIRRMLGEREADHNGVHIARHNPSRSLREVACHRAMLELAWHVVEFKDSEFCAAHDRDEILAGECESSATDMLERIDPLLAVWSDHPDYRQLHDWGRES